MSEADFHELNKRITAHIDERIRKLTIAVMVFVIGGIGSLIAMGMAWGTLTTKVSNHLDNSDLHMRSADKYREFVSRAEYIAILGEREKQMGTIQAAVVRIEAKVDHISKSK